MACYNKGPILSSQVAPFRPFHGGAGTQPLDSNDQTPVLWALFDLDDRVSLRLGGPWNVAHAFGIIQNQLKLRTTGQRFQPHLGSGPVQRAADAPEVHRRIRATAP